MLKYLAKVAVTELSSHAIPVEKQLLPIYIFAISRFVDKKQGKAYNTKVAFQVLIEPDSYDVGAETIGARHEIDPDFSNQEMEWSTKTDGSHILSGLLVKLY